VSGLSDFIALFEYSAKFSAGNLDTTRNDRCGVAQIDDPHLASVFDAPPVSQFRGGVG
jgi:hypothetical protein